MDIKVIDSSSSAVLKHDVFGAIYLEYNNNLYLLYILPSDVNYSDNSDNDEKIYPHSHRIIMLHMKPSQIMQINNNNIDYHKGNIIPCSTSLKEDVQKNLETENDIKIEDYFPENKFFISNVLDKKQEKCMFNGENSDDDNDNDEFNDDMVGGFTFYGSNSDLLMEGTVEQYPCNYDTVIAKGDTTSKHFIFNSECENDHNSFRITIFTTGTFTLNIIGTSYVNFNLVDVNGKLELKFIEYL